MPRNGYHQKSLLRGCNHHRYALRRRRKSTFRQQERENDYPGLQHPLHHQLLCGEKCGTQRMVRREHHQWRIGEAQRATIKTILIILIIKTIFIYIMNKLSLILLALFVGFASANAQIEDDGFGQKSATPKTGATKPAGKQINVKTKNYNYELSVGARVGGGMTRMSEGNGLKFTDGSGLSFGGGLAANIRFGGKDSRGRALDGQGLLGAALELNYKYSSVKTLGENDLKMGYFEVPILFQIYPCYNTKQLKNLYVEVGPTIAGTLSSSPETIQVGNSIYHTGDIKGFDVKATVGVGYRFNKTSANDGFYINARYYLGTSELAGNFPAKLSTAEFSIGYLFKCIGTKKK